MVATRIISCADSSCAPRCSRHAMMTLAMAFNFGSLSRPRARVSQGSAQPSQSSGSRTRRLQPSKDPKGFARTRSPLACAQ